MATDKVMAERLRLAAARCIVHNDPEWWSTEMTDTSEFNTANAFAGDTSEVLTTPGDAANFLLLCAEELDE